MAVMVLDKRKKPLMPCSEKRARQLLERGRARIHRLRPFVIRLVDRLRENSIVDGVTVRVDPGSRHTGVAVTRDTPSDSDDPETERGDDVTVLALLQIDHRGHRIRDALTRRRQLRRARRHRKTRYRPARFDNRRKPEGWLAPSVRHVVDGIAGWIRRLRRWVPVGRIDVERSKFDTQLLQDPEISSIAYQQGTLAGYEVREYLLEKWRRCCAYCDATGVPLTIDHIIPRSRGGSDRISNLTLACEPCNTAKGANPVQEFLAGDPARLAHIRAQLKRPLAGAAVMNAMRNALVHTLEVTGLPVRTWTGGRTKFNRTRLGLPKSHALDAACTGNIAAIRGWRAPTLLIAATGRGSRQRTRVDRYGFPISTLMTSKTAFGFRTGDLVRAIVPRGKNAGTLTGRVAIRASGSFNIKGGPGQPTVQGISHRHCRILQRGDGYGYDYAARPVPASQNQTKNNRET